MKRVLIGVLIWLLLSAPCYGAEVKDMNNKDEIRKYYTTRFLEIKKLLHQCKEEKRIKEEYGSFVDYNVPKNRGFKSYMPYTAITMTGSKQYKLQKHYAYTGNYGIRQVNGRYCVALGTYFTDKIGQEFDLILENGTVIPCILGDQKANKDTDSNNKVTRSNGCVSEFVVDSGALYKMAKRMGDISYCCDEWNSPVEKIRVYDRNVFNTNQKQKVGKNEN